MSKALIHELGKSRSFGKLSWRGKLLWPMLLTTSDDQGRGLADVDVIKWSVCPNVQEITQEEIPGLLEEMQEQGMILLYSVDDEPLYQVVNWWKYQQMTWAHPSKHPAPEDWTDRVRYNIRGGEYVEDNWKEPGGFVPLSNPEEIQEETPPTFPPGFPDGNQDGKPTLTKTQLNSTKLTTQPNLTAQESSPPTAEIAVPQKIMELQLLAVDAIKRKKLKASEWQQLLAYEQAVRDPPRKGLVKFIEQKLANGHLSPGQVQFLALFGAKRFSNPTQARTVQEAIDAHGLPLVIEVATWATNKGFTLGNAVAGLKKTAANWNNNKKRGSYGSHQQNSRARAGEATTPLPPKYDPEEVERNRELLRQHNERMSQVQGTGSAAD